MAPALGLGVGVANLFSGAVGLAPGIILPSWVDRAKSIQIDFVNDRAQRGGVIAPITSLMSCVRASPGKAYDGRTWFDIGPNLLRYKKGGPLFVEPYRMNYIRNSDITAVDANGKPTGWTFNVPSGGVITYSPPGVEDGIRYIEFRYQHPGGVNVALTVDAVTGVACALGQTWTTSARIALPAQRVGLSILTIGGRAGGGAQAEFPSSAGFVPDANLGTLRSHTYTLVQNSTSLNSRIGIGVNNNTPVDIVARIGFHMLSMEPGVGTFVITPVNAFGAREADLDTIALPSGSHDLTFTFSDATTQLIQNVSGNYQIPLNLSRTAINKIEGVRR